MIRFYPSRKDRIQWISYQDASVGCTVAEYQEYLRDFDVTKLKLTGTPTVWLLVPLDRLTYERAKQEAASWAIPGIGALLPAAVSLFRLCCVGATEGDKDMLPDLDGESPWTYDPMSERKVLRLAWVKHLPPELLNEAAHVLLDTLTTESQIAELKKNSDSR